MPIAPWIDQRCASHDNRGLPLRQHAPERAGLAWGLDGLDQTAQALFGAPFRSLHDRRAGRRCSRSIRAGDPPGEIWRRLPAKRWWVFIVLRQITGVYYAHPYAWDEIGFGGPAYPRGYFALNFGAPEPWEAREARARHSSQHVKLHVHLSLGLDPRYGDAGVPAGDEVDFCIIGTGAGGGVLAQRLARFGFSVVALEAGPWHDTETDMVSDEAGSGRCSGTTCASPAAPTRWSSARTTRAAASAAAPSTTPASARACIRPTSASHRWTAWPPTGRSRYDDLEPYYAAMEREYPVSGPARYPWGKPHGYPYAPLQAGTAGQKLIEGCVKLGIPVVAGGPVAIPAGRSGQAAALHHARLLPARLQGRRKEQHAGQPHSGRG